MIGYEGEVFYGGVGDVITTRLGVYSNVLQDVVASVSGDLYLINVDCNGDVSQLVGSMVYGL